MFATFKRQVNESGILTRYKECQVFESKSQKRRRKDREADLLRRREQEKLKTRLREHFG
jgi:ribosomal protein S21